MARNRSNAKGGAKFTKPGKHGTLTLYAIEYTDGIDRNGFGTDVSRIWAYDANHAIDKFIESNDGDSWEPLRIAVVREGPTHRWNWQRV